MTIFLFFVIKTRNYDKLIKINLISIMNNLIESEIKNGKYVCQNGTIVWYKEGKYHREDGPAIEIPDGSYHWYLNGVRHRNNGPALYLLNESEVWYQYGEKHRENGPAIQYQSGHKKWFLEDVEYTEEEFFCILKSIKQLRIKKELGLL